MRAVRVALHVGERVMLAMVGDPVDHRALHGHRAEHGESVADRSHRVERPVRVQAVVADRDPDRAEEVHEGEDRQVGPAHEAVPEHDDGDEEAEEGEHDGDEVDGPL
jgi:hypothetical protein